MSMHRRTFAVAALAALGLTASLAAEPASASPERSFVCSTPQTQRTANLICRNGDSRPGRDKPEHWGGGNPRWSDSRRDDPRHAEPWQGRQPDWRGPQWPGQRGPVGPYSGRNPDWLHPSGPLGPPF
jgi:hypothetical protein